MRPLKFRTVKFSDVKKAFVGNSSDGTARTHPFIASCLDSV